MLLHAPHNVLADSKTCSDLKITYYNPFTGWAIDTPVRMAAFEKAAEWRAEHGMHETTNHLIMCVTHANTRYIYISLDGNNAEYPLSRRIGTICHVLRTVLEEGDAIVFVVDDAPARRRALTDLDLIADECRLEWQGSNSSLYVRITVFASPDIDVEYIQLKKIGLPLVGVETHGIVVWCIYIPRKLGEKILDVKELSAMAALCEAFTHAPRAPRFVLGDFCNRDIWLHNKTNLKFANTNIKTTFSIGGRQGPTGPIGREGSPGIQGPTGAAPC